MSPAKNTLEKRNGVFVSPFALERFRHFEASYLQARSREHRLLSIEEIRKLPEVDESYMHFKEWQIRKKNIRRFLNYLEKKKQGLRILDIGCGNGFFTHLMSTHHSVVGVDVNLTELLQAAEAFPKPGITWYCADVLEEDLPEAPFDLVVFCASFQYFDRPEALLARCRSLLKPGGEIHIIDSPFYDEAGKITAKQNSLRYYQSIRTEAMIGYYHHNTYEVLKDQAFRFKYRPGSFISRLLRVQDSPFPWIVLSS